MLPQKNRLSRTKDMRRALSGKRAVREGGVLLKTGRGESEVMRVGIVVSKKVAKKAVDRNRIRRVIAEAVRERIGQAREGVDIALIVLPGFEMGDAKQVRGIIDRLLKKASLV